MKRVPVGRVTVGREVVSDGVMWAYSSMSDPNASVPPTPNSTANSVEETDPRPAFAGRRTVGSERRFRRPGCTDEHGCHHREHQERQQRFPTLGPGSETAVERTDEGQPDGRGHERGDQQHRSARCDLGLVQHDRGREQHDLEHAQLRAEGERLAEEDAARAHSGHQQRVERAVGGLHAERPLDEHEQAEQRGQPHQAGRHSGEHGVVVEREREHHHHERGERQHLVGDDPAAHLDAQVLRRHETGDAPRAHAASPADRTWPPTTSTTRVARAPARSSS